MNVNQEVLVTGIKKAKGDYEGKPFDSTTFFVETDLTDRQGNARGKATAAHKLGTSAEFDKWKHLDLPFKANATFAISTSGKDGKTTLELVDLQLVAGAKKAA